MPNRTAAATILAVSLVASLSLGACSAVPTPTPAPTPTPTPTAAPATATTSPSPAAQGQLVGACLQQVNSAEGAFTSYIDASLNWDGPAPKQMLLIIGGTNDDQAAALKPTGPVWDAHLGMTELGPKTINSLIVVYNDGSGADITAQLAELIGGGVFEVRPGSSDGFGTCDV